MAEASEFGSWTPRFEQYAERVKQAGYTEAYRSSRLLLGAKRFILWALEKGIEFDSTKAAEVLAQYDEWGKNQPIGLVQVRLIRKAGVRLLTEPMPELPPIQPTRRERHEQAVRRREMKAAAAAQAKVESTVERKEEELGEDEQMGDEQDVDVEMESAPASEVPEPHTRRATATPPAVNINLNTGRARGQNPRAGFPAAARLPRTALPADKKVNIFRQERSGKLTYIDQYNLSEVHRHGVHKFLKEFIDTDYADSSGTTVYVIYEVGVDGSNLGNGMEVTVSSPPQPTQTEPVRQLREVIDVMQDLRGPSAQGVDVTELAKQRVANNPSGGLLDLIGLMLIQNMNRGGSDAEMALKVAEKLNQHGVPLPVAAAPLAPVGPSTESQLVPIMQKIVEKQLDTKPPEPKSTIDFLKEMAAVKELFKDDSTRELLKEMITEVKALRTGTPSAPGPQNMVTQFKEIKEMVQTLAPALKMDGIGGVLQNLLTPALAQAVGNALAPAVGKAIGANTQSQLAQGTAALPRPAPGASTTQPVHPPVPASARPHAITLRAAKTEVEQIEAMLQLLQAFWLDPAWQPRLEPLIQAFIGGDKLPVQNFIGGVFQEVRPDLATGAMIEKVTAELVARFATQGAPSSPPPSPVEVAPPVPAPAPPAEPTAAPNGTKVAEAPASTPVPEPIPAAS